MKVTDRLYAAVKEIWDSYNQHPFVKGIAYGTLDMDKFQFYMVQDYLYLMQYSKVFALGIVKAETERDMRMFADLVHSTLNSETATHRAYLKRLGITAEDVENAKPSLATQSYTNYMLSVSFTGGIAEVATTVLACAWSYKMIGDFMESVAGAKEHEFYGEWVKSYTSKQYRDDNDVIIDLVDRLAENYTQEQIQSLENIIVDCSRYEYMFWDMAWNKEM
ncbi:MAG: thiaminase II [Anaerotignaceae bacterium]